MKKKFFKKLSFVLALAMMISVIAPAAGALAASGLKLNSTNKYLHLDVEGKDEYNFNFTAGKKKGYQYFWYSTNEKVATVNPKNGVTTAKGAGKTTIICEVTDADGEFVDTVKATVTVRDNIKEVKISNPVETLKVNEEHDFNRSYVTVAGNTKGSGSVTRWTVEPSEGATINDKGVFVATKAGEYTITARSFQSKAKYNDWKADDVSYAKYVLAEDTTVVKVGATMVEAKQKNLSKVDVKFSSPMDKDEVKENIYVHYVIGDVDIKEQKIKDVKLSADGLTATVAIYDTFVPKATYKVTYPEMDPKTFVAATTSPEDVVGINITTTRAKVYENTEVKFELLDKNGVVINQPVDVSNLNSRVVLESSNEYTSLIGNMLTIFKVNDTTTVTATYHTYEFINGNEIVYKDAQTVVGVEEADLRAEELLAWTIVNDGTAPNFDSGKTKDFIAAGDKGRRLYVQLKLNNSAGTKVNNYDPAYVNKIKLTSSDSSVLFVDETGYLIPVKQGVVRVTVEYDDTEKFLAGTHTYVASFTVTVSPERKPARLSVADAYYPNVSNSTGIEGIAWSDDQTVRVHLLDQYGDKVVDNLDYAPNLYMKALSVRAKERFGDGEQVFNSTFRPAGLPEGKYQFLIFDAAYPNITGQVTFDVKAPVGDPTSWKVEVYDLNKDGFVDVAVNSEDDANKQFGVALMAYARNGVKLGPVNLNNYDVRIKDAKGNILDVASKDNSSEYKYNSTWVVSGSAVSGSAVSGSAVSGSAVSGSAVSGSAVRTKIDKLKTGKYTIDVLQGNTVKARGIVTVVDTQTLPVVKPLSFRTDYRNPVDAFNECFDVTIKDRVVIGVSPEFERTTVNTRAFAKKVVVQQAIGDSYYIEHEVNVGYYITVPVDFDGYIR